MLMVIFLNQKLTSPVVYLLAACALRAVVFFSVCLVCKSVQASRNRHQLSLPLSLVFLLVVIATTWPF